LVLPFLGENASSTLSLDEVRRNFVMSLARSHDLVLIEPQDLPQDPKKFIKEDYEYDMEALSKLAASLGIAALIEGKVFDMKARRVGDQVGVIREVKAEVKVKARIRMMAARNGQELFNETREATADSSTMRIGQRAVKDALLASNPELSRAGLHQVFLGMTPALSMALEKLSWQGRVAMISGERVFVNAGRLSGLQVGDILKISEEGDEIFDPQTGRFIGKAPGRMKGTVEVVSYFGKDGSITVIHSGSGFSENDLVELY
ncbi:MAG: hypothetical protein KDD22_07280, partial [Bdellovibrionales bacterium]|nr:hypothetical protein [Bdellovibrionales bacterium]